MASYAQPHGPASEFKIVEELVTRWNDGDLNITNNQAEKLAYLAAQHGLDFDSESNPIGKFAFDLANTATFGLVPNSWRPETVGEKWHGESKTDKFAGGLGTIGGLFTGVGLAGKALGVGAKGLGNLAGRFFGGRGGAAAGGAAADTQALIGVGRGGSISGGMTRQLPGAHNVGYASSRLQSAVQTQKALNARERAWRIASDTLNKGNNFTNRMISVPRTPGIPGLPIGGGRTFQPGWGSVALGTGIGAGIGSYMSGPSDEQVEAERMMNQYNTLGLY